MRTASIPLLCLMLAGCGNYSNEDLEFLYALPSREDLSVKLPSSGQSTGALEGLGQRRDALAVGDESSIFRDTHGASVSFNQGLDSLLGLIEGVRKVPPTTREPDRRTWGPFPLEEAPAYQVRMVMVRQDVERFTYALELQPKSAPAGTPWWTLLSGAFRPSADLRKGKGELRLDSGAIRARGVPWGSDSPELDSLDVVYATDEEPKQVQMTFNGAPGAAYTVLRYGYRELADGTASMTFVKDGAPARWEVSAAWLSTGPGKATVHYVEGTTDLTGTECWDAQARVTYSLRPWEQLLPVGDLAHCPQLPVF